MATLLQLAAQCNGVQPSESCAFTSHPNSTKNLREESHYIKIQNTKNAEQTTAYFFFTHFTISKWPAQIALCKAVMPSSFAALAFAT